MGLIAAKCPQCGADVKNDDSREFMFCSYCGSKVMFEKQIVELKGTVAVDGIATVQALANRAEIFLADRQFDRASECFDKILDINPHFAKAYWGLLMCHFGVNTNEELIYKAVYISGFQEYINAVSFGDSEEKALYESVNEKIIAEIARRHEEKAKVEARKELKKIESRKPLLIIGMGVSVVFAVVSVFLLFGKWKMVAFPLLIGSLLASYILIKDFIANEKKAEELSYKFK